MDRITVLRAFVRLVERGSFTAVADELRVKQSTISKWIAALEDELGVALLDRTTRFQRITDAGQRFYAHSTSILTAYDQAVAEVTQKNPVLRGRIRINMPVAFGRLFVVPQITKFLRRHKDLEIEMVLNDRYVSLVDEGFDIAVRVGVQVDSTLKSHALGESTRRLVASPGYLRAHGTPQTPRDLADHQCLVHTELSNRATWTFKRAGRTHRVTVGGRASSNNSEATLAMAKNGLGICLLASWLVDSDLRAGRVLELLPEYETPNALIRALTPPGRHVAPQIRALVVHLREAFTADP